MNIRSLFFFLMLTIFLFTCQNTSQPVDVIINPINDTTDTFFNKTNTLFSQNHKFPIHNIYSKQSESSQDSIQANFQTFKTTLEKYQNNLQSSQFAFFPLCENYQLKWKVIVRQGSGRNIGIEAHPNQLCEDLIKFKKLNDARKKTKYKSFTWEFYYQYIGDKYAIVNGYQLTGSINNETYYYEAIK